MYLSCLQNLNPALHRGKTESMRNDHNSGRQPRCAKKKNQVSCEWRKDLKKLNTCNFLFLFFFFLFWDFLNFFLNEVYYVESGQRCVPLLTIRMLCIPKTYSPNGSNLTHAYTFYRGETWPSP